jgi:hypothetical protein
MRSMREDGDDQRFGVRANGARPAPEAVGRPFGVAAMRARHVVGIGAMPATAVAALMGGDTPAAMEHLDGTRGNAHIDLGANERVRHRVVEAFDLDMVIEPDAGETPFRIFVILRRQSPQRRPLDALEQIPPAHPEATHDMAIHAIEAARDRRIAFREREEGLVAQPAENVALGKAHASFDLGLVARLSRTRRKHADTVMGGHHAVAAIDLRIVERSLVNAALEIVRHYETRHATEEAEHPHMRTDPVWQGLREARLGIGVAGGAEHADENLGVVHNARARVDDCNPFARIIDKHFVAGRMMLAHDRRKPPLELAEQIAEPAVSVTVRLALPIFLPQHHQAHAGAFELARQRCPIRLAASAKTSLRAAPREQSLFENVVGQLARHRPSDSARLRPPQIVLDRAARHAQRAADLARAHPVMVQPQHVS